MIIRAVALGAGLLLAILSPSTAGWGEYTWGMTPKEVGAILGLNVSRERVDNAAGITVEFVTVGSTSTYLRHPVSVEFNGNAMPESFAGEFLFNDASGLYEIRLLGGSWSCSRLTMLTVGRYGKMDDLKPSAYGGIRLYRDEEEGNLVTFKADFDPTATDGSAPLLTGCVLTFRDIDGPPPLFW